MTIPAWIRSTKRSQLGSADVNPEGLTFEEWLAAAGFSLRNFGENIELAEKLVQAWKRGEDPTEWRATHGAQQKHGFKMDDDLEGLSGTFRPWEYEIASEDWDESARTLIETINAVGHFYYGSLQEALEAGPYENSQEFVMEHLHWLKWWYEVYEGSKIERVFERRFR